MSSSSETVVKQCGRVLHITLNRPKALNALTLPMVRSLWSTFARAGSDQSVTTVLMTGAGGRAFCAGGDVRAVWDAARSRFPREEAQRGELDDAFFREEYSLNAAIAGSPKPQVSVWDGFVMGGGAGVSVHGTFRVATERALFAMPETNIGLFPDVGASHFLSRLPGELGTYLGLTGARIQAADLLYTTLATHFLPSASLPELEPALATCATADDIAAALARLGGGATPPDAAAPPLLGARAEIDHCFAPSSVPEILARLDASNTPFAGQTAEALRRMSPDSLALTLMLIRGAKALTLGAALRVEFRACQRCMRPSSDFFEGVRAALVDKDRSPEWRAASVAELPDSVAEGHLEHLGERELVLETLPGFRSML